MNCRIVLYGVHKYSTALNRRGAIRGAEERSKRQPEEQRGDQRGRRAIKGTTRGAEGQSLLFLSSEHTYHTLVSGALDREKRKEKQNLLPKMPPRSLFEGVYIFMALLKLTYWPKWILHLYSFSTVSFPLHIHNTLITCITNLNIGSHRQHQHSEAIHQSVRLGALKYRMFIHYRVGKQEPR